MAELKTGFVALIGRPNVGKSTLMNRLIGQKIAITSNKPQTTRNRIQTVYTEERGQIIFLDTPGILWPKFEDQQVGLNLALTGSINDEILNIEELAGEFIRFMQNRYPGVIEERYGIENCSDVIDAIENIAKVRGCLLKGGAYDTKKASRQIIDDFRNGKLGRISLETPVK